MSAAGVSPSPAGGIARMAVLAIAILLSVWIGIRAATPPAVVPASAPAAAFSAERAMDDVRTIALRPHPAGSADMLRVRDLLAGRLRALGLQPEERRYMIAPDEYEVLQRWNPQASPATELVDLVAVLPGRDRLKPAVAMMAHMDTVWGSPGSGDDSVGVASILETLRAIRARGTPERDIVVLLTDGEEIGLAGAKAFWPSDGLADHVGVVVNLEARGAGGRATMFETGEMNGGMIRLMAESVRHPVANAMAVLAYRLMPNSTDFTVARDKGLPGFNFAIMARAAYYHSPRATADRLDPRSLQDMGNQALDLVSALATTKTLPGDAPDRVFFDVDAHRLIAYRTGVGWLVLIVAMTGWAAAWLGARRALLTSLLDVGRGVLAVLWLAAVGGLLLGVLNLISGSGHANYYDRLAALPRLEVQSAIGCLAALVGWLGLRGFPRRALGLVPAAVLALIGWLEGGGHALLLFATVVGVLAGYFAPRDGVSRWGGWLGAIGVTLLIALIAQVEAPMAAWIFAWPATIAATAAALVAWADPAFAKPWSAAIAGAALVAIVAPLLPLAHLAFLGIGAPMPEAMLAALVIAALALWPLARIERAGRGTLIIVCVLLVAAVAIAVQVRIGPVAETVPAYSLDK